MTVELVARRQGCSLEDIHIYNLQKICDFESKLPVLKKFDARHMNPLVHKIWASTVVAYSHKPLSHVTFDCEREIAILYSHSWRFMGSREASHFTKNLENGIRVYWLYTIPSNGQREAVAEPLRSILTVKSLHLSGIDCKSIPQIGAISIVNIDRLTTLYLESCFNVGQSFSGLSSRRSPSAPLLPQLRSFKLRQKAVDMLSLHSLRALLLASKGLVNLAVLLESCEGFLGPDCFTANHGSTLRMLVCDQRRGIRTRLDESTAKRLRRCYLSRSRSLVKSIQIFGNLG